MQAGAETGDRAIARLAARQHGVVTRAQLVAAGLGRGAIEHRVAQLRLHRVHRGVYLVGHAVPAPLAREMAAALAFGDGAVISHRSAAAIWDLGLTPGGEIHVTIPGRNRRSRLGVRVHRVRELDRHDITRRAGVPVTSPGRTLLDLAEGVSLRELEGALGDARRRGLVQLDQLRELLARSPGRHGARSLRVVMDGYLSSALTRSEAERRILELLRAAGLTPTGVNVPIAGYEVDLVWQRERLVVEVDGYAHHARRSAFERDRVRDAEMQAAGYDVVRVTWRQLVGQPEAVVARVARALATSPGA